MTYRPYPSADRALHQLARHVHTAPAPVRTMRPETAEIFKGYLRAFTAREAMTNAAATLRLLPSAADLGRAWAGAARPDPGSSR